MESSRYERKSKDYGRVLDLLLGMLILSVILEILVILR